MKLRLGKSALTAFAVFSLFTLLAGDFWRNLLGWVPFLVICAIAIVIWGVLLLRGWNKIRHRGLPLTLVVFVAWATISVAWSFYRGATVLAAVVLIGTTLVGFGLAYLLPWSTFVRALGIALRWIIATSIIFELWVALIVQHPVLPVWLHVDGKVPGEFYWCEGLILRGGPIQGIMGNRNLLGFVALVAIVTFSVQVADKLITRVSATTWIALSVLCIALTQSATVIFAMVLVFICGLFALWARMRGDGRHRLVYWSALVIFAGLGLAALAFGPEIAWIVGRSPDFTGRADIWQVVIHLWEQKPVLGWGWISYWAPWVAPFDHLVVRHGVTYLQAHNAWLDVGMQLGIIGVVMFAVLIGTAIWRAWFRAVDRPRWDLRTERPFVALHMLPLFLLACLCAQSLAESRILVEGGWALLVIAAVATKLPDTLNEHPKLIAADPLA
jgi:exopolysaccharide production protein ExoQ